MPPKKTEAACRAFLLGHLRLRPLQATGLGWRGLDDKLEDLSPAGVKRQAVFYAAALRRFRTLRPGASGPEALDLEQLERLSRFCLRLLKERPEHPASLEHVFDLYETLTIQVLRARSSSEWKALDMRLAGFPRFIRRIGSNLARLDRRLRPDRRYLEDALRAFKAMGRDIEDNIAGSRAARLGAAARASLEGLSVLIEREVFPSAGARFALGREEYAWRVRHGLGFEGSPEDVDRLGRSLLRSIHADMRRIARRLDRRASGRAGLKRLMDRLSATHPRDDKAMFALYRRLTDRARRFVGRKGLFEVSPGYVLKIIPTPPGLGDSITTAAYFVAPPFDSSKKGYFLVTPSRGDKRRLLAHNRWHAVSTAVHEAFPGHDMQYFLWQKRRLSPWRFLVGDPKDWSTSMNIEGYAHYAEELMRRHGFYSEREELFQLAAQAWRAARLVVDAGLHTGRMDFEAAARFMENEAFLDRATARGETFRYTKWPTQALTYALGKLEIERLKEDCRKAWGPGFSETRFHSEFLSYGPLPPVLIRKGLLS